MDARIFCGCGSSRNFASQLADPDWAAGVDVKHANTAHTTNRLERRDKIRLITVDSTRLDDACACRIFEADGKLPPNVAEHPLPALRLPAADLPELREEHARHMDPKRQIAGCSLNSTTSELG